MVSDVKSDLPCWEDTMPHFSTREKGDRITAMPLNAPGMLTFFAVATFILWVPAGVGGALYCHTLSHGGKEPWLLGVGSIFYMFLPSIVTSITTDEARNFFGQRTTAKRISAIPAFTGAGVGILGAAIWVGGSSRAWLALASAGCGVVAAVATLAAWRGIRYTRDRQTWMAWLRHHGERTHGVLREISFLEKWSDTHPLFTVVVEFSTESGPRRVEANMITAKRRVPRKGTAVVVTLSPNDSRAEVHIELDYAQRPEFDPAAWKYSQPSGN